MVRSTRFATLALAGCLLALAAAPSAQAQAPTLAGESFVATGDFFFLPPGSTPGEVDVNGTCNASGTSTFTFTASGPAAGPYPGTFTETGSFTMQGPPDAEGVSVLTDFQASFEIHSLVGEVTGTKEFTGAVPGASTVCRQEPFRVFSGLAPTHYEARIETGGEAFTTEGEASSSLGYERFSTTLPPLADYSEFFITGTPLEEAPPDQPTTKDECKKGGYQAFGFENQGDCVAFVATGGKNEPGQNVPGLP